MHEGAREYVTKVAYGNGPWDQSRVIECGSYNVNGTIRDLFDGSLYTGVDRLAGPGVDVVADFASFRLPELAQRADLVICCEVLEHTPDREGILAAAFDALRDGGLLCITCATEPREPHGVGGESVGAEWYGNVDPYEFGPVVNAAGFTILEVEVHRDRGDLYVLARKGD